MSGNKFSPYLGKLTLQGQEFMVANVLTDPLTMKQTIELRDVYTDQEVLMEYEPGNKPDFDD